MDLERWGATFHELRISKGFTLKQAAGECYSTASLSKFENGTSSPSAAVFFDLLENINVHILDFWSLLGDEAASFRKYYERIATMATKNDYAGFHKLRLKVEKNIDTESASSHRLLIILEFGEHHANPSPELLASVMQEFDSILRQDTHVDHMDFLIVFMALDFLTDAQIVAITEYIIVHHDMIRKFREMYFLTMETFIVRADLRIVSKLLPNHIELAAKLIDFVDEYLEFDANARWTVAAASTRAMIAYLKNDNRPKQVQTMNDALRFLILIRSDFTAEYIYQAATRILGEGLVTVQPNAPVK
ncbi:MAG: helix-turn-helix domain-containing protein [Lactobacillaceae bacterium]|jgi:transcriptional regulator with XRE-family HTH domain|nr:helix-turn-helix domain-containing protein [Lactobacillaceae bacterium]